MARKLLFGTVLGILLIGGTWWFFHAKKARAPIADAVTAVPSDAALIFESRQSLKAWKKLSQTNIMWEELLGTETVRTLHQQAATIDSLLALDPRVASILDGRQACVSLHPGKGSTPDVLYVCCLPDMTWQDVVEEYFESTVNLGKPIYTAEQIGNAKIGVLQLSSGLLYFAFSSGIVVMSSNDELLRNALTQQQAGNPIAKDERFARVRSSAGENADVNFYVNYRRLPHLIKELLSYEGFQATEGLSEFAAFSGWDINIKPNALSMSGFTAPGDRSFLGLFTGQKAQEMEMTTVIPDNTAGLLYFGLSDPKSFYNDYLVYQAEHRKDSFVPASDEEKALVPFLEAEMATLIRESATEDLEQNTFSVLRVNAPEEMTMALLELGPGKEKSGKRSDTISYRGHLTASTDISGLLHHLFASKVTPIQYFTPIGNYMVIASSRDALKTFIDQYESHRTWSNSKNYKAFSENISATNNILLYTGIARSAGLYTNLLNRDLAAELTLQSGLLRNFEAAAVQFSSGKKTFYSSIYLKYNPEQKQESGTLWETKLDTTFSSRPFLLLNHNTKAKEVFVQDDANKIYLISNTGKILWTKQLREPILSEVIQVDVLKNDKLQLVFNTRSSIYMFDRNGNEMTGFPLKLRSPATNGIAVIDYEKNRDYRIFIATENKRVVCYKANAEQVTAFAFDKTQDQVTLPLQYFSAAGKDHLAIIDRSGNIYILDRQGKIRVKMDEKMPPAIRNFFVEPGHDYNRSYIIAADTLGNVRRIYLNGKKEDVSLQHWDSSPFFDLKDLNNDKTREMIFLTRNELSVFTQDKSLLFRYEFPERITLPPLFFSFHDNTGKIGAISDLSGEVFLFNENGSLYTGFPLRGRTLFSIGDLNHDGHYNLVTGSSENSIFVYQLK